MSQLFPEQERSNTNSRAPLADRMRPRKFEDILGQEHLLQNGGPLERFVQSGDFPSMIFWGPPGSGKTTIAYAIAETGRYYFIRLSAVESGVKEVREVISNAEKMRKAGRPTLLFIDEIHRFNKSQQDALLHAVEKGIITLIGATTENPSFEVNSALLSRCQVYRLLPLNDEQIRKLIERALADDEILSKSRFIIEDWDFLLTISGGDARAALNAIELSYKFLGNKSTDEVHITRKILEQALQQKTAYYDKQGESHYDTISAFIKSLRGSDPDAAVFWLAKMIDAGEDPKFIARRMVIFASEDIGNADPFALSLAISVFHAVELIGMPEARINLAQGVTYLASAPKSNASYLAIMKAAADITSGAPMSVPMHLRNAPTKYMKQEGYGKGYKYPHDHEGHFVEENYFPESMEPRAYYEPGVLGREENIKKRLESLWKKRYKK